MIKNFFIQKSKIKRILIVIAIYVVTFLLIFFLKSFYTCPFKKYFGINCFGCGMTRAFFALINFRFALAFENNPMIYPLAFIVFGISLWYIFIYKIK